MTALDNLPPQQQGIINAAIALVQSGCTVVPTRKDGGKAPAVSWKEYQATPPTAEQIINWFVIEQHTGIGIITGKASSNLEMIELEGRAVEASFDQELEQLAYAAGLEELWDRIWSGWTELSPSGGIHWFIRISDGIVPGNTKLAVNATNEVLAETRGEGGFVVVAPSYGNVHETGNQWTALEGNPTTIATLTWEERNAFIDLFRSLSHHAPAEKPATKQTAQPAGDRPGDQWAATVTWQEILEPHGWRKIFTTAAGVTHWRRPGKDTGTSATTGYSDTGNLYVFTTNAHPFEGEQSYSKFAAHALLNFAGNYQAAAQDLANKGYGTPQQANELKPLPSPDLTAPIYSEQEADELDPEESTWKPIDLHQYWQGTLTRPQTGILYRQDGHGLLYPGRVHSFYGESESGKSWLAQIATVATLTTGGKAVYIDFEGDPEGIVERLKNLNLPNHYLNGLRYLRPETPRQPHDPYWQDIINNKPDLIVIDGVTEALTIWGAESKDNDAITSWTRIFPRYLAKHTKAAVITIDHVAKDKETRGRFAIGGQAKLASIDGAAYLVEPLDPLAPGKIGRLTVRVTKDRPGTIRSISGMWSKANRTQESAVLVLDATKDTLTYRFDVPLSEDEVQEVKRDLLDHSILLYIKDKAGCGKTEIERNVKGDDKKIRERVAELRDKGLIENRGSDKKGERAFFVLTPAGEQEANGQLRAFNEAG